MRRPFIYRLLWPLGFVVFKLLCRFEVLDKEKIPRSGPVILAANHRSYIDVPLVALSTRRVVHFMGKAEIWNRRLGGWISTIFGAFPVRRGLRDRAALETARYLLDSGEIVCVFPEGTRVDTPGVVGELQGGVTYLAEKSGAPIVPLGICGADRLLDRRGVLHPFQKVLMKAGDPITLDRPGRLERAAVTTMLRDSLKRLVGDLEGRTRGPQRPRAA